MIAKRRVKQAKLPENGKRTGLLAIVGLALLAVIAVGLTAVAFSGSRGTESDTSLITPAPPVVEETPQEPEPEAEPEPEPVPSAAAVQRLLVASETPGHLLRATVGECTEPAGVIEVSFNGGADWSQATTADVLSTKILQLDASMADMVRFVSLDTQCQPQLSRSFVGGLDWGPDEEIAFVWYLDQNDSSVVHTPGGAQPLPCSGVGLSSMGERAIALCSDTSITVSRDAGVSWTAPVAVPNAAAVGITDAGYVVASANEHECVGVRLRLVSGNGVGEPGQCLAVEGASGGNVAVSSRAGEIFLWAADRFVRSADGGATWL